MGRGGNGFFGAPCPTDFVPKESGKKTVKNRHVWQIFGVPKNIGRFGPVDVKKIHKADPPKGVPIWRAAVQPPPQGVGTRSLVQTLTGWTKMMEKTGEKSGKETKACPQFPYSSPQRRWIGQQHPA